MMNISTRFFLASCFAFLLITQGSAQQKSEFTPLDRDLTIIDSLIRVYQAQGFDFKEAFEKAAFEINDTDVELRYQTYIHNFGVLKPGVPRDKPIPGSIKVNRNDEIKKYTPTELVRNILLNSYSASDKERIQNVRFFGVGGDGSPDATDWLPSDSASIMPAESEMNIVYTYDLANKRKPIDGDRSLAYFEQDDTERFPLKRGLVLSTSSTFSVEGPNEDMMAFGIGVNHKGLWGAKIPNPVTDMFDVDATNTIRQAYPAGNSSYGAVLEFDFKPAIDEVKFDFIFGSEEYAKYVHGGFNDIFGFYVSGPFDEMPDGSPNVDDYGMADLTKAIEKRELSDKAYTTTTPSPPKVLNTIDTVSYNGKEIKRYVRYNIAQLPNGDPVGVNTVNWGHREYDWKQIIDYGYWGLTSDTYHFPDKLPFEIHPDTLGFVTNMLPAFKATFPNNEPQVTAAMMLERKKTMTLPAQYRKQGVNMAYFRPIMKNDPLLEANGITTVLEAKADKLVPEKWYHLKILVAQVDYNHGDLVFLANLDLGRSSGALNDLPQKQGTGWKPSWDSIYGGAGVMDVTKHGEQIAMYHGCTRTLNVTLQTNIHTPTIDLTFNEMARDYLDITYKGVPVKDSIALQKGQTTYQLQVTTKELPESLNGKVGIISSIIRGTTTKDTIFKYTAYNRPTAKVRYKLPTIDYRAKLELDINGGTPHLFASVNQGSTWFPAYEKTPLRELQDLPDTFNIWLREPNSSCEDIIIPIVTNSGFVLIARTIEIPTFANATTIPHPGLWEVESREDFTFTLIPSAENRDKTPLITTSRNRIAETENPPLVTKNNDGSYTVTIKQVTEDFKVSVDFPLILSISEEISPQVWTNRSQLYVHALEQQQVQVYTLQGIVTKAFDLVPGETRCTTLPAGIYLVRLGSNNKTYKVRINE